MRKILRCLEVQPEDVATYTFSNPVADTGVIRVGVSSTSTSIVLVPVVPHPGASAEFPVGPGYRVSFDPIVVPGVSRWLLAQFGAVLEEDPEQDPSEVTALRARLSDGVDDYVWSAGSWTVVADVDADWNTLEEFVHGLVDWDPEDPLGIVIELSTTDGRFSPSLSMIKLMFELDLPDEFDDWIYNALVGNLTDDIRPEKDIQVKHTGGLTVDFGAIESIVEDKWAFGDVVSVFDLTDDPHRRTNLLSSFDDSLRIATLASAPAVDHVLLIRALHQITFAVTTDQDYFELAKGISVTFDRIQVVDRGETPDSDYIMDEFVVPPVATVFPAPRHADVEIDLSVNAPLAVDAHRISAAITRWLNEHRVLVSPTTGEKVTVRIVRPLDPMSVPDRSGMVTLGMSFRLEDLYFHHRPAFSATDGVPGSAFAYGVTGVQVGSVVGSASSTTAVSG